MSVPTVTLNDGNKIPVVAFGTGTALYAKPVTDLVLSALETGYISLDTAEGYANSASVGEALRQWGGKREDVYVLTKWSKSTSDDAQEPRRVLEGLLKELGTDYVDAYLIHSPLTSKAPLAEQWAVFEQIKRDGLARSVGVSNFRAEDIELLSKTWTHPPAVNQIEYNPYIWHAPNIRRLAALQAKHAIKFQTYGPLNSVHRSPGGPVDAVVARIAKERGVTDAQVLLQWAAQHAGGTVVTTSRNKQRQEEQLAAFKLAPLTDAQVAEIADAGKGRFFRQFLKDVWDSAEP